MYDCLHLCLCWLFFVKQPAQTQIQTKTHETHAHTHHCAKLSGADCLQRYALDSPHTSLGHSKGLQTLIGLLQKVSDLRRESLDVIEHLVSVKVCEGVFGLGRRACKSLNPLMSEITKVMLVVMHLQTALQRAARAARSLQLKAQYTSRLRPHNLVA